MRPTEAGMSLTSVSVFSSLSLVPELVRAPRCRPWLCISIEGDSGASFLSEIIWIIVSGAVPRSSLQSQTHIRRNIKSKLGRMQHNVCGICQKRALLWCWLSNPKHSYSGVKSKQTKMETYFRIGHTRYLD